MINGNLKKLSSEELNKREQQMKMGYVVALLVFVVGCQKSNFFGFLALIISLMILSHSEEIKKELKSRRSE